MDHLPELKQDLAGRIHIDGYGDMTDDIAGALAELRLAELDRCALAADANQAAIAREFRQEATHLECGEVVARIDQDVLNHWEMRYGRDFFSKEKGDLKWFLKKFPAARVRSHAANPVISLAGLPSVPSRGGRWHAAA